MKTRIRVVGTDEGWVLADEHGEPTGEVILPKISLEEYHPEFVSVGWDGAFGIYEIDNPAIPPAEREMNYKEEQKKAKRKRLLAKASRLEMAAERALFYNADGLIDEEGRKERFREFLAKAEEFRKEAERI